MRINGSESLTRRARATIGAADEKRVASHGLLADELALLDATIQTDGRPQ